MNLPINIRNIPEVISLTDLRYRTNLLLRKVVEEGRPLILVKKSRRIAVIYPLADNLGRRQPEDSLKIKAHPLGVSSTIKRSQIYNDYLEKKIARR